MIQLNVFHRQGDLSVYTGRTLYICTTIIRSKQFHSLLVVYDICCLHYLFCTTYAQATFDNGVVAVCLEMKLQCSDEHLTHSTHSTCRLYIESREHIIHEVIRVLVVILVFVILSQQIRTEVVVFHTILVNILVVERYGYGTKRIRRYESLESIHLVFHDGIGSCTHISAFLRVEIGIVVSSLFYWFFQLHCGKFHWVESVTNQRIEIDVKETRVGNDVVVCIPADDTVSLRQQFHIHE